MIQKANVTIHIVNRSLVTSLVVTSFNDSLALVTAAQFDIVSPARHIRRVPS